MKKNEPHAKCLMTNDVLIVARTRHIAEHYMKNELPVGVAGHYVASSDDAVNFCPQHVMFLLVGDWYMSASAERTRDELIARGFKQAQNPRSSK